MTSKAYFDKIMSARMEKVYEKVTRDEEFLKLIRQEIVQDFEKIFNQSTIKAAVERAAEKNHDRKIRELRRSIVSQQSQLDMLLRQERRENHQQTTATQSVPQHKEESEQPTVSNLPATVQFVVPSTLSNEDDELFLSQEITDTLNASMREMSQNDIEPEIQ